MSTTTPTRTAAKAEVEPIAEFEPVSIKRGHPIELVRWWHGEDGWGYDLVQGRYRRRDRDTVTVDVDGELREFARDQWHVCAA